MMYTECKTMEAFMYGNQREAELAMSYIAGLIDGEGSFMISRSTSGKGRITPSYTARIKISMTEIEPLLFVKKWLGLGTLTLQERRKTRPEHQNIHTWQVHSL